jgi:hypothetical protein
MENKSKKSATIDKNTSEKRPSNQPEYADKPWQTPQYGNKEDAKGSEDDSCGCGS